MINAAQEKVSLNSIAGDSWYAKGCNAATVRYCAQVFARHMRTGSCLELGPAEGLMTAELVKRFEDLTCVDGAEAFCIELRKKYPRITVVNALFEEYEPNVNFDHIVLGHVLEHVEDPVSLLRRVREWVSASGVVLACVPNARSIHRQLAVLMGLLETEYSLNDTDRHHGHRRVYNAETLRNDFLHAGFAIEVFGGYWLKPLSNAQIEATWTPEMVKAAMQVGERYPDIAAEIYVVARAS